MILTHLVLFRFWNGAGVPAAAPSEDVDLGYRAAGELLHYRAEGALLHYRAG